MKTMFRSFVTCILVAAFAASAFAAPATVKIINQSKWEIHHVYLSPSDEQSWGEDYLGEDVLAKGDSLELTDIECGTYDVKVVDEDGDECIIESVKLCGDKSYWKITDKDLIACSS